VSLNLPATTINLLSLPEEVITQIYIIVGENTRALVRLSAVNRCLRVLWLQDSDCIIAQSLAVRCQSQASIESMLQKMTLRYTYIYLG
jgi:hypothetical protein